MPGTEPLTALQAAPLFKALLAVNPAPVWTDFERDFLNELVNFGARVPGLVLSSRQSEILIQTYYRYVILPKLPARSAAGQAKYDACVAAQKKNGRATKPPRVRPNMQDADQRDEPPF